MSSNTKYICPICNNDISKQDNFNPNYKSICCSSCHHQVTFDSDNEYTFFDSKASLNHKNIIVDENQDDTLAYTINDKKISKNPIKNYEDEGIEDEITDQGVDDFEEEAPVNIKQTQKEKRKKKSIFKTIILFAIVVVIIIVLYALLQLKMLISPGFSSENLNIHTYQEIVEKLDNAGFNNIKTIPIYDLEFNELNKDYKVSEVKIGEVNEFTSTKKFLCTEEITITYHTLKPIPIGVSSDIVKRQNYETIVKKLEKSGFKDIEAQPIYDLYLGLLAKENTIIKMTVNDESSFEANTEFRPDAKIVITYHAFVKEQTVIEDE